MKKSGNFLIVGLKESGKSTYFVTVCDALQHAANAAPTGSIRFRYSAFSNYDADGEYDDRTADFIEDGVEKLRHQEWLGKTQKFNGGYCCELVRKIASLGIFIREERRRIIYNDYPGEAYEFCFRAPDSENAPSVIQEAAKELEKAIANAEGIFLLIDAEKVFQNSKNDKSMLKKTMVHMFERLQHINSGTKLAIIFNKLELLPESERSLKSLMARFARDYANAVAWLPMNHNCFAVYTLGETEVDPETGFPIPGKILMPKGVIEPVAWMLGLEKELSFAFNN